MLELPAESANVTFRSCDPGKRHHLHGGQGDHYGGEEGRRK